MRGFLFKFLAIIGFILLPFASVAQLKENSTEWQEIVEKAKGQELYFNAWGGSPNINDYIAWVGSQVFKQYGITLKHVKLSNTADAVNRVLAEKKAGRNTGGSIDLIWINGENFASMKRQNLLQENAWSEDLPNYALLDIKGKAVLSYDFTEKVDGLESPWGTAQLSFYYDSANLEIPPKSLDNLKTWIKENPGRFTYANAENFIGTTFLKQLAFGLMPDIKVMQSPVNEDKFQELSAPIWAWLDEVHPYLWRKGKVFARDTSHLKTLLADSEISIAMTFNPGEASSAINEGILPNSVRSFVLDSGSIGNAHFVAIPFNANASDAAKIVANFMISPIAQAKKADEKIWGDPSVIDYEKLNEQEKALFDNLEPGKATLGANELGNLISEPDASWSIMFKKEWQKRYSGS